MASQNASGDEQILLIQVDPVRRKVSLALTQIFVLPFIYLIFLMLIIFSKKETFRTETRYILFGHSLLVDLIFLCLTDFVVLLSYNLVLIPLHFCIPICILTEAIAVSAPLTIGAMCVERYVAICMPLRHHAISTSGRAIMAIKSMSSAAEKSSNWLWITYVRTMASQNASNEQIQLVQVDLVRRNISLALTQIFVWPFIYLIFLMLLIFSKKETFRTEARYILFACAPLTITAMCVERYVAICMPLRHHAISTSGRAIMSCKSSRLWV
ncbi:olfactory receptor 2M5 [Pimephales promelas]|nr:olfactory receptor 2M5 [Pimephales promelas]